MKTFRIVLGCVVVLGGAGFAYSRWFRAPQAESEQGLQSSHKATSALRSRSTLAASNLEVALARGGMETDSAGYHLIRPSADPLWKFGTFQPSSGHRWWATHIMYPQLEYQHPFAAATESNLGTEQCVVSQSRLISNPLGIAAAVPQSDGKYNVVVTISDRARLALSQLLQPAASYPDGTYADWFSIVHAAGAPATALRFVVVCNEIAYLPIDLQAVLSSPPGPVGMIVASGLSAADAQYISTRLGSP